MYLIVLLSKIFVLLKVMYMKSHTVSYFYLLRNKKTPDTIKYRTLAFVFSQQCLRNRKSTFCFVIYYVEYIQVIYIKISMSRIWRKFGSPNTAGGCGTCTGSTYNLWYSFVNIWYWLWNNDICRNRLTGFTLCN